MNERKRVFGEERGIAGREKTGRREISEAERRRGMSVLWHRQEGNRKEAVRFARERGKRGVPALLYR